VYSVHADAKLGYENVTYYTVQITAWMLLDKKWEYKDIYDLIWFIAKDLDNPKPKFEGKGTLQKWMSQQSALYIAQLQITHLLNLGC